MPESVEVFVGVGSNVDRERSIREGLRQLRERHGELRVSPVYDNVAVGFAGRNFFNLVVSFATGESPAALVAAMREIEYRCGRPRGAPKFAPRPLDLDLLLYGDLISSSNGLVLPREDILRYGFVLKPLADLAPKQRHPVIRETYSVLWKKFSGEGAELLRVDIKTE